LRRCFLLILENLSPASTTTPSGPVPGPTITVTDGNNSVTLAPGEAVAAFFSKQSVVYAIVNDGTQETLQVGFGGF
jgi:hypothetical protein